MLIASKSSMDTELYALTFEVSGMLIHIKHRHNIIIIDVAGMIERKRVLLSEKGYEPFLFSGLWIQPVI